MNATRFSSRSAALLIVSAAMVACSAETPEVETSSDGQVADYIEKYPLGKRTACSSTTRRALRAHSTRGCSAELRRWS